MFSLLIAVAYVRNVMVIVIAYVMTLFLAKISKISVWFFVKRVWLFIPIFSGIIILPSTLSVISPGEVVLHLFYAGDTDIGITRQGLAGAQLFVMRIALSISLVVLLTLSTKWNDLLQSLRILKVPKFFVLIVGMSYRYIFLLLGLVVEMYESRKSRTIIKVRNNGGARNCLLLPAPRLANLKCLRMKFMTRWFRVDTLVKHELLKFLNGNFVIALYSHAHY